jgi:hypothetical protein
MRKLFWLLALSTVLGGTPSALAAIVAGDNPSGPTTVTTNNGGGSGFAVFESVSYDGAAGAWQKELIHSTSDQILSGDQVPINEHITNSGPSSWTGWHEEVLSVPGDPPFPDFLFTAGSLQLDRNGVPLIQGADYTLVPTTNNTGIGVTPGGDWVALSIFFRPNAVIHPGDTLGIRKNIFEVFGDGDIWDPGEFALVAEHPSVPEPSTIALAGLALLAITGAGLHRRRRRNN